MHSLADFYRSLIYASLTNASSVLPKKQKDAEETNKNIFPVVFASYLQNPLAYTSLPIPELK